MNYIIKIYLIYFKKSYMCTRAGIFECSEMIGLAKPVQNHPTGPNG